MDVAQRGKERARRTVQRTTSKVNDDSFARTIVEAHYREMIFAKSEGARTVAGNASPMVCAMGAPESAWTPHTRAYLVVLALSCNVGIHARY